jgi:hypothetical protein
VHPASFFCAGSSFALWPQLLEHLQFTTNAKPQTPHAAAALAAYADASPDAATDAPWEDAAASTAAATAPATAPRLCTLLTALVDLPCGGRR